jgi:hypothetical protein
MKILTFVLSGFLVVTMTACATHSQNNKTEELRSVFEQYKSVSNKSDTEQSKYFTEKMWKELQESRDNPQNQTDASIKAINNFPNEVIVENTMESVENGKGCLIVQGNSQSGAAMDYNIGFTQHDNRWVFSDISVTLYDSGQKRWLTEPVCDTEQKQLLWLKHLQQEAN